MTQAKAALFVRASFRFIGFDAAALLPGPTEELLAARRSLTASASRSTSTTQATFQACLDAG
jgi:hypothetical protein